jgi:hypothetical protein
VISRHARFVVPINGAALRSLKSPPDFAFQPIEHAGIAFGNPIAPAAKFVPGKQFVVREGDLAVHYPISRILEIENFK